MIAGAALLAGCAGPPRILEGPTLDAPADVPLARGLSLETDVPTRLTARIEGEGVDLTAAFPGASRTHHVPLLGFRPGTVHDVTLTLSAPDRPDEVVSLEVETAPLPDDFPRVEALALDPDRIEPGYVLLPLESEDRGHWLAAADLRDGAIAWLYTGPENFGDVRRTPDGTFLGLGQGVIELSALGDLVSRWSPEPLADRPAATWTPFAWPVHHEVTLVDDDAFAVLTHREFREEQYPTSYDDPWLRRGATLLDAGVVAFDRDGGAEVAWWYGDLLDPQRIGFDSLDGIRGARDWVHGNAIVPRADGRWLASSRHQDALFSVAADGTLEWLLASPAGWREPWRDRLLTVVPDGAWTYHQHGPSFDAEGRLLVFDNHDFGFDPYEPPVAEQPPSRVVAYVIDEDARTATVAWEWVHPERLYSAALGNATERPDGTVVACFGFLDAEGAGDDVARGLGRKVTRVVALDPGVPDPVVDLRFWYPRDASREGVKAYRAVPTPTLYADDVSVTHGG